MKKQEKSNMDSQDSIDKAKKVNDTFIGFIIGIAYVFMAFILIKQNNLNSFFIGLSLFIYLSIIALFFLKKRRFVSIGLALIIIIPFSVIGSCKVMLH